MSNILVPDPLNSDKQFYKYHHYDIEGLSNTELIDELHALRPLLWWRLPDNCWLRERVKMLEGEFARRKGKRWQ